ncbi:MAG: hypothetical protein WA755_02010 [Candidatus Acidiferrales bacterium]
MSQIGQMFSRESGNKQKLNRVFWWSLGIIVVLQLYFVRELLAAELLFGIGFAILFSIGMFVYMIGRAGERSFSWAESRTRALAHTTRRGLGALEEISRRPFRHPRSESAQ